MLFDTLRGNASFASVIVGIISSLIVVFLTLPIHEFSHAFVATKLGDQTPRYQGRLTVNPFAHIDYIGALCIILFGFGWAKPVQINARSFKNPKWGMALSALAGPVSNVLVAIVAMLLGNAVICFGTLSEITIIIYYIFVMIAQINVYLAVFNLLPVPPLDGSRILFAILPQKYYFLVMKYERYISIALIALLFLGVLSTPLMFLSDYVFGFVNFIAALPFSKLPL